MRTLDSRFLNLYENDSGSFDEQWVLRDYGRPCEALVQPLDRMQIRRVHTWTSSPVDLKNFKWLNLLANEFKLFNSQQLVWKCSKEMFERMQFEQIRTECLSRMWTWRWWSRLKRLLQNSHSNGFSPWEKISISNDHRVINMLILVKHPVREERPPYRVYPLVFLFHLVCCKTFRAESAFLGACILRRKKESD